MVVNLPAVSKNPRLLAFFKGFLVTLDGLENYLFWAELQEVRARFEADPDSDSLRANSWILYQEFLQPGARYEIIVPEGERKKIFEKINTNQVTLDIFGEVEVELIMCLQNECIPKFLASEWYQRYEDQNSLEPEAGEMEINTYLLMETRGKVNSNDVSHALEEQSLLFDRAAEIEKDYLERVRILVHGFKTGLESVLKKEDCELLFGNVEQIYQVHQHIAEVMVPDYPIPMLLQRVIFERHFLDIYTRYLTNLPFVRLLWEVLLKDSRFSKAVHSLEKGSKSRSKKTFEQLLFEVPVDHLKSLHSLLTPTALPSSLSSSNEVVGRTQGLIADLLALSKDQQPTVSQKKLFELREKLIGYPGNLTKPDRHYIMEGPLLLHSSSSLPLSPPTASSTPSSPPSLLLPPSKVTNSPIQSQRPSSPRRSFSPRLTRPKKRSSSQLGSSSPSTPPVKKAPPSRARASSSSSSSSSSPSELYFFLFNDKLVAAKQTQTRRPTVFPNASLSTLSSNSPTGLYKYVNFYPLLTAMLEERGGRIVLEGVGPDDLCLEPKKEDYEKWCNGIQRVVNEWKEQRQQQRKTKEQNLVDIVQKMKLSVQCQDRGCFRKFKNCFTGTDGVYFFISKIPGCNTREEAEAVGTQLLQAGYITSCTNLNNFKEKNSYYRFA